MRLLVLPPARGEVVIHGQLRLSRGCRHPNARMTKRSDADIVRATGEYGTRLPPFTRTGSMFMRKFAMAVSTLAATFALFLPTAPAQAQATRTWVSGVGDDANPCSRTAPCKTFAGAISKTAPGGEIDCLDPGGFGAVTITKAITIDCHEVFSSILNAGTNGINVAFDSFSDVRKTVNIRNINLQGFDSGIIGIRIFGAGAGSFV